jgi:[ribosomal protein S5]-alanine N-acetyltransferase
LQYALSVQSKTILETQRLRLSHLSENDASFIIELLNEPAFIRDIGDKGVRNLEDARRYIADGPAASYTNNGFGLYRVELRETEEPIGMCGLLKRDILEFPDLGYALLARHWGKGYAIEAATATMEHATQLGLDRVLAITALENPSSIRVLEKLGFRFDSVVPLAGYETPSKIFTWERGAQE